MLALKGRYDGRMVILDGKPPVPASDVIVTFLEDSSASLRAADDGSLAYLFKGCTDDGIREPLVDFGEATGNEQW
jgi:hypothetical protein